MQKISKNKGITLVSLVITIIILLILAGVAIATLKNSGILGKAKTARNKYQNSANEENGRISSYENEIDKTEINIASSRNEIASNLIEYKGIECRLTEENQIKFFKNQKEIWPIYWYGLEPIIEMYNNNIYYWNETNNIPKIIKKIELNRDDLKIFDIKLFICPPLFYYNTFFINIH